MQENVEAFEPSYDWHKEEEQDVLEFHVPGFKGEELLVQVSGYGLVKVSGNRILNKGKQCRFQKELKLVTKNYKWDNVQAKLSHHGTLRIILPRKVPHSISSEEEERVTPTEKKKNGDENVTTVEPYCIDNGHQSLDCGVKFESSFCKGTLDKKRVIWLLAAVVVTVVVIEWCLHGT